jgi:hypothetical protein
MKPIVILGILICAIFNIIMLKQSLDPVNMLKLVTRIKKYITPTPITPTPITPTHTITYVKDKTNVINDDSKPYPCDGSKLPQFGCVLERAEGLKLCDSLPSCIGYLEPGPTLKGLVSLAGLTDPIGLLGSEPVPATSDFKSGTFYMKKV